jgi:hypothetical protein
MAQYWSTFMAAVGEWNTELNTTGSSVSMAEGLGWTVSLDPAMDPGDGAITDPNNRTIRFNPMYLNAMHRLALHELGHVLYLDDVTDGSCADATVMFHHGLLGGVADSITPADDCTIQHVYFFDDESPIILTLDEGYPRLTGAEVYFDLSNCGTPQLLGWTAEGAREGFLVLDRNGDGHITSGAEMFGNYTPLAGDPNGALAVDGFRALAAYDEAANGGDGDGWITPRDRVYASLRLWVDMNHNGFTDTGELKTLSEIGVVAISLDARETRKRDRYGNEMRYVAAFFLKTASGELVRRLSVDVYFVQQ